jgi:RND family efflux transporter MFP subunit
MMRMKMRFATVVAGGWLWSLMASAGAAQWPARLAWQQQVELSTPVSGVVGEVAVTPGQRVAKGTLLLALDQRLFRSAVARAEARLAEARQLRDEAAREQERSAELFERTLLSEHDRQLAEIALARAQAAFSTAQADLTEARVHLEYSRLIAPFDAWVTTVAANVGETVVSRLQTKVLVSLAAAGRMRAVARLGEQQLGSVSNASVVAVLVAGQRFAARLEGLSLEPVAAAAEPQYALSVQFDIPQGVLLRPGQTAVIEMGE